MIPHAHVYVIITSSKYEGETIHFATTDFAEALELVTRDVVVGYVAAIERYEPERVEVWEWPSGISPNERTLDNCERRPKT